jgi:hypothetical protein
LSVFVSNIPLLHMEKPEQLQEFTESFRIQAHAATFKLSLLPGTLQLTPSAQATYYSPRDVATAFTLAQRGQLKLSYYKNGVKCTTAIAISLPRATYELVTKEIPTLHISSDMAEIPSTASNAPPRSLKIEEEDAPPTPKRKPNGTITELNGKHTLTHEGTDYPVPSPKHRNYAFGFIIRVADAHYIHTGAKQPSFEQILDKKNFWFPGTSPDDCSVCITTNHAFVYHKQAWIKLTDRGYPTAGSFHNVGPARSKMIAAFKEPYEVIMISTPASSAASGAEDSS